MLSSIPRLLYAIMTTDPDAPWCLDLFCGAGGAGMGYKLAGFNVLGVDIKPQPRYPGWFAQGDALEFAREYGHLFDLIHASPVCKKYSESTLQFRLKGYKYPDQIAETRAVLQSTGKPYVIENIKGAAHLLINPMMLCGTMFPGLYVTRHRYFECYPEISFSPSGCRHTLPTCKMGRKPKRYQEYIQVVGNFSDVPYARIAMGIPWMVQGELNQSFPPAFTKYVGEKMKGIIYDRSACTV